MLSRRIEGMTGMGPLAVGLVALTAAACSKGPGPAPSASALHPVGGRVLVGGKPAEGVQVTLYPLNHYHDADAPHPYGTTDGDGRFHLHTGADQEGAPNGQYVATLVWPTGAGGPDRLGGAFAEPSGTGLTAVIEDATTDLPAFEVAAGAAKGAPR
jgi:hypothetical protein